MTALAAFDDDAIGFGLWSVLDSGGAGTALAIGDVSLPLDRWLRSGAARDSRLVPDADAAKTGCVP